MATYSALTFATGLILTFVIIFSRYQMNDKTFVENWWIEPLVLFILTIVATFIVSRITNRNNNEMENY